MPSRCRSINTAPGYCLSVDKKPAPMINEVSQVTDVGLMDVRVGAGLPDSIQHGGIDKQAIIALDLPLLRIQASQLNSDFKTTTNRFELFPVGNPDTDTFTQLPFEFTGIRCELDRCENNTRQFELVEFLCENVAVQPAGRLGSDEGRMEMVRRIRK